MTHPCQTLILFERSDRHLGEQCRRDTPSRRFPFLPAILSCDLLLILGKHAVYGGVPNDGMFFLWLLIGGEKILVVVDTDDLSLYLEHHLFARDVMGNEVPVAVVGKLTFLVDRPEDLERGVVGDWRKIIEQRLLLLPPLLYRLPVRAVYPSVGRLGKPVQYILVGLLQEM